MITVQTLIIASFSLTHQWLRRFQFLLHVICIRPTRRSSPIVLRRYVRSLRSVENERSLVAVVTGKVANSRSKMWIFGKHIASHKANVSSTFDGTEVSAAQFTHHLSNSPMRTDGVVQISLLLRSTASKRSLKLPINDGTSSCSCRSYSKGLAELRQQLGVC